MKLFRTLLLLLNIGTALLLFAVLYASYVDVSSGPSILSLFSFGLPFLIVAAIVFAIFWLIFTKKKCWCLISIIAIGASWPVARSSISLHPFVNAAAGKKAAQLKVMTYNVHLFDLGEWTKDKSSKARILKLIEEQNPDIICLQEFYFDNKNKSAPFTDAISQLGYPYFEFAKEADYQKGFITINAAAGETLSTGTALFSKYPLSDAKVISIDNNHYKAIVANVTYSPSVTFTIITTHLQSVGLGGGDLNFIDSLKQKPNVKSLRNSESRNILFKLRQSATKRARQANRIAAIKKDQDFPLIICGDMNDVPGSYVYQKISQGLEDPFIKKGFGIKSTFTNIIPTLRIDHIFYDAKFFEPTFYDVLNVEYSDHLPVIAYFSFRKN